MPIQLAKTLSTQGAHWHLSVHCAAFFGSVLNFDVFPPDAANASFILLPALAEFPANDCALLRRCVVVTVLSIPDSRPAHSLLFSHAHLILVVLSRTLYADERSKGGMNMVAMPVPVLVFVALLLNCATIVNTCRAQQSEHPRVVDAALGIAFNAIGTMQKSDSATFCMTLLSSSYSSSLHALAEIAVSDRLFVDLPGSYGGRVYLDVPSESRLLRFRVLVDSVSTGGYTFRREYWTVYAGMGMWEGTINCFAHVGGRYYIISLDQIAPLGKPGEEVDGKPLVGEEIKAKLLSSLRDSTGELVGRFTALLSSVQILPQ